MSDNRTFLENVGLFSELPEATLATLAGKMLELQFPKGARICEENKPGDALFVIKAGIVQIFVGEGPEKKVLAYLKRGEYFGEMAVFTGDPRSASATALADVTLLGLTKADFEREVRANPALALDLLKTLSRRLAQANLRDGKTVASKARLLFVVGSEKGAGKSVVARELAHSLAKLSGGQVLLVDPNVQSAALARSVGIEDDCDLAKELVAHDAITVERYVKKTPWGFSVLVPQRVERTTYPLKESHHHILMNALAERFDYLVVDSSSTMARFNKHMMQSASRLVVVLSGRQTTLESYLGQFENLVLGQNGVDRRKVLYVLNACGGAVADPNRILGKWAQDLAATLPYDPAALAAANERRGPALAVVPDSTWSEAVARLGRDAYLDHSLEAIIPLDGVEPGRFETATAPLAQALASLFGGPPERETIELQADPASPGLTGRALRFGVRTTAERMNSGMDEFLNSATAVRASLGVPHLLVRIDGRPSLIS